MNTPFSDLPFHTLNICPSQIAFTETDERLLSLFHRDAWKLFHTAGRLLKTGAKAEKIVRRRDDCLIGPSQESRLITGNYAIHTYEIGFANLVESSTFTISFGWQTIVVTAPKRPNFFTTRKRSNSAVTHADHKDRLDGLGGRLNRVLTPHASPNLTLRVISQLISIALNPEPTFPHIPLTQVSHFSDWWHCYAHAVYIFKSSFSCQ